MLKFSKLTLLSALLAFAAGAHAADEKPAADKSAALVNGVSIPQSRVDLRVKMASGQSGQPDSAEMRKDIREELISLEVLSQSAVKSGLDKQAETAQQLELSRQTILANALMADYMKTHPVSEDVLKQEYEAIKARVGNKEYKVTHVLVATEEEAKTIIKRVKKEKLTKLAKEKSIDPSAKENGGDLGWIVPFKMVRPFGEAILTLSKGQISAPVQTQYGWHVIRLEDTRELKVPTFEELRSQIEQRKQQEAFQKHIIEMREKAKIE